MKKYLWLTAGVISLMMLVSTSAFAANTAAFNVTISIAASADITVQGGPIDFGVQGAGSSAVASSAIIIKNSGSGSSQTYSLNLINPLGWTAVSSVPGFDQYRLSAAFDSDGAGITWGDNCVLTTASVPASATRFSGDQSGSAVAYNAERKLWLSIDAPSGTSSPSQKTIQVALVATVD